VDSVDYVVKVFDRFESGVLLDELAEKSGRIDHTGFHTIDLDSPLDLNANDDFYVYLYLSDGGQPFDRTSIVPVLLGSTALNTIVNSTAHPGESYYFNGSSWQDLYNYDFGITAWNGTANFCIKALTVDLVPVEPFENNIPGSFILEQNYPNPFNSSTKIEFQIPKSGLVTLKVYNLLGEEVATLVSAYLLSGFYSYEFDASNLASGVYVYRLSAVSLKGQAGESMQVRKALLLK